MRSSPRTAAGTTRAAQRRQENESDADLFSPAFKVAKYAIAAPYFPGEMQRVLNAGARPQRLLWASTGTKDPKASNILYVQALALPFTVNTMPEVTLKALAVSEEFGEALPANTDKVLADFAKAGIDADAMATQLLGEGVASFAKFWNDLLECIASKSGVPTPA